MILLISFVTTVLFFSNLLTRNAGEEQALDLSEAIIESGDVVYADSLQVSDSGSIRFQNLSIETETVTVIFQPVEGETTQRSVTGNIYIRDDSRTLADTQANGFIASPVGVYNVATVRVDSNGALRELRIDLETPAYAEIQYEISGIILNVHESVRFSFLSLCIIFIFLIAIYLIWKYKLYTIIYDPNSRKHKSYVCLVVLLNLVIACSLGYFLGDVEKDGFYINYYEVVMISYGQDGTIAVPMTPSEELLAAENPYDVSSLTAEEVDYPWDMAFYNGSYYIYFGIAPLILLYIPCYLVTGLIAPPAVISTFLTLVSVIGIGLLLMEVIRKFCIQANLLMLLLIQFALPFCMLLYMIQVSVDMYYIALLSAITGLIWFLFFAFRAARERHPVWRRLLFFCTAAALVMVAASRPTLALFAVAVIPLFFEVLWDKERRRGAKALDAAMFAVPVLAGAAGLMFYNVIRFDSVFEFGASYQLTISDVHYQTVELSVQNFVNTLVYYFFYPLSISTVFPYVLMTRPEISNFGNYFYRGITVGAFGIPYYLSLFRLPSVRFRNKTERWTIILLLVSAFVVAYIDYCVGGVMIRYVSDLMMPLALVAAVVILKLEKPDGKRYGVSLGLIAASLIVGVSLIFSNERNYFHNVQADLYIAAKNLFSLY